MILASLFQDGAILQRDMDIPVWGKTVPNALIQAELDGKITRTRSAADGSFILYFPAREAGGPYTLTVSAPECGKSVTVKDILIGEVWVASGQSNMVYLLGSDWRHGEIDPAEVCVARKQEALFNEMIVEPDKLRVFMVDKCASGCRESSCQGKWMKMTPENAANATAVGAWFGLGLQMHLNIPVGIIGTAWGGTIAEAWTSYEALANNSETANMAKLVRRTCWASKNWEKPLDTTAPLDFTKIPGVEKDTGIAENARHFADTNFDDSSWKEMHVPGSWMKQNIAGNGVLWARKSINIPESWANSPLKVTGGVVDKHDTTFFNGVEIGKTGKDFETQFYNTIRTYSIPPELVKPGKAVIAVRAYSFFYDGAIRGMWRLVNEKSGESIELIGNWQAMAEVDRGVLNVSHSPATFGPGNPNTPGILFDGMVNPLLPYAVRGVIWYQGESNATDVKRAIAYRDILQNMIDDWRRAFRNPDMPFIMVQLAGFGNKENFCCDSSWAELRESQRLLTANDPDSFMASAIDIGEEEDIHPQNKFDVGKRLAMSALHHVYQCAEAIPSGPEINKVEVTGNKVKFTFDYADKLKLVSDEKSFYIAGSNGEFHSADSVELNEDEKSLTISSSLVADPVQVKYAWADFPIPTLFNGAGLPASSFRWIMEK